MNKPQYGALDKLKADILRLRELPADFRDLPPGCDAWTDYCRLLPNLQATIDAWVAGPVLHLCDLTEQTKISLGPKRTYVDARVEYPREDKDALKLIDLIELVAVAEGDGFSLLVLPPPGRVVRALNILLSESHWNLRAHTVELNNVTLWK